MPSANTYASPSTAGGNREDLRDVLTILEPEGTPVTSMIRKGPAPKATLVEVLADTLRAARSTGTPEGLDVNSFSNKASKRQRFGNYIHIIEDSFAVTDVEMNVAVAGTSDLYGEAKAKCLRELKRDLEAIVCGDQEMVAGNGSTGWQTRGLVKWIQATAQALQPVPTDFLTPAGNISTAGAGITEAQFNAVLQSLFLQYGQKRTYEVPAGVAFINTVDNFTRVQPSSTNQRYNVYEEADKRQITLSVRVFDSSFGIANLIPDQFVKIDANGIGDPNSALFLNMELLELQFQEALHSVDLPDYGGGPRGYCKAIAALCVKNPKGLGKNT